MFAFNNIVSPKEKSQIMLGGCYLQIVPRCKEGAEFAARVNIDSGCVGKQWRDVYCRV